MKDVQEPFTKNYKMLLRKNLRGTKLRNIAIFFGKTPYC